MGPFLSSFGRYITVRAGRRFRRDPLLFVSLVAVALVVALMLPFVVVAAFLGAMAPQSNVATAGCTGGAQEPSATARTSIPANYLDLYKEAGRRYGVPWSVLAAIGRVETDHGRLEAPGVREGTNFAGAAGPMQFLASTWAAYGVDGNDDGIEDMYDPRDAIPSAARYLSASGAPGDLERAIFAYNHANWYVDMVLDWASRYARGGPVAVAANFTNGCVNQALGPVPQGVAGQTIDYARRQLGKPYVWGTEGPTSFDCSGLTQSAFAAAGISIPRVSRDQFDWGPSVPPGQERPGDLVFFGYPVHHVGLVIGNGQMIEAPYTGAVVRIRSYEGRDDITGFTRPAAHESVQPDA